MQYLSQQLVFTDVSDVVKGEIGVYAVGPFEENYKLTGFGGTIMKHIEKNDIPYSIKVHGFYINSREYINDPKTQFANQWYCIMIFCKYNLCIDIFHLGMISH